MSAQFVNELLSGAAGPTPVDGVRAVLVRWQGERVHIPRASAERRQRMAVAAGVLLRSGLPRAEATRLLAERFGISHSHSSRIFCQTLRDLGSKLSA